MRKIIKLRCFIVDAPTRAFILEHTGYGSCFPCSRCKVKRRWIRSGVMIYESTKQSLRTEEEYFSLFDQHHHRNESALTPLPLNIVQKTVFGYMHLMCLVIMVKMLQRIVDGRFANSVKLSSSDLKLLDQRLALVSNLCPSNFARKPINIKNHCKF